MTRASRVKLRLPFEKLSATKGKRAKVKVEVQVDPAQIEEAITEAPRARRPSSRSSLSLTTVISRRLKATFNKASDSLVAARSALVNPGTDREEKRYLKAAIPKACRQSRRRSLRRWGSSP